MRRGFQPEIDQVRKLLTLLTSTTPTVEPEAQPAAVTQPVQSVSAEPALKPGDTPQSEDTPPPAPAVTFESPADAQATPPATPEEERLEELRRTQEVLLRKTQETLTPDFFGVTQPASPINEAIAEMNVVEERTPVRSAQPPTQPIAPPPAATEAVPLAERASPGEAALPAREARISVADEPPISPEDTETPTELSLPTLERQLTDARAADDRAQEAKILHTLGQYHADRGHPDEALTQYQQALAIYESIEDNDGVLAALDALAAITAQADDVEGALVYATRGVNLAKQVGERDRLGRLQTRLGDVRLALGDLPAAVETYTQAVETMRGTENWLQIGMVMAKLGSAYLEQDKPKEAIMMLEQALVIFMREQHVDYQSRVLGAIGAAYSMQNEWSKAAEYHDRALLLARRHANRPDEAVQLSALAHICEIQTDRAGAIQFYRQALHVAYLLDDLELRAEIAFELGRLLMDDTRTLMQAVQLLRESDSLVQNSEARRLLSRADKRLERTHAAGIELPPVEGSNRDYAASAYAAATSPVEQPGGSS
jgi:tetratricopeptide (TPR) repeat protein